MSESLAGSKRNYVRMQIKDVTTMPGKEDKLNIQGSGNKVNRAYGVATLVMWKRQMTLSLINFIKKMPKHYRSFAPASQEKYFIAYCRIDETKNLLLVQIPSATTHNREYGAQFKISISAVPYHLYQFIKKEQGKIKKVKNVGKVDLSNSLKEGFAKVYNFKEEYGDEQNN